jgi:class 3 adenylate cyclase
VSVPRQAVAPVAERRVCSVLFCDLVGFTPLSESRDPEEVRELLSRYFEVAGTIVGRYGGAVEKFIGDAVMAVWGVPVAHEDDAERSVRAALEIVSAVSDLGAEASALGLAARTGVVTGEVAVTVGAKNEGMVAGDAVNTASRVQSIAGPGQVWVDETTRALASAGITFEDAGEHTLKGKAEPVRLWRAGVVVADLGGGQRVDGLEAPLAGRSSDLRLVKELFHATSESGRPKLVVIDGEAGIGKSRLGWEFFKYIDGLTATTWWHQGRCLSYGDGVAFWALAEAVRVRFGLVESDTGPVVAERLEAGLEEFVDDPAEREWLRPRLAVLLGTGSGAAFAREDLFAGWTIFLEHLAADGETVVLVIDDAQHADDGLLDFLDHLLTTARGPIFVVTLARPELLVRRPELGGRRATVIRLEPLGEPAMGELVDGLVLGLPGPTRSALVARAEGIPLFAVETVRALIDRDLVIPREGRYVPADGITLDLDAIGAPASLQALVAARLDAMSAAERRVVTDASVLGASFTGDGLIALGSDPESLERVLGSLARREIITVQSDRFSAERGQFRFVQSVVRQVAYSTQSKRDRKTRHLAAAEHLVEQPDLNDDLAVVIAQHLLDAADSASATDPDIPQLIARAMEYLERAATRARAIGAPGDAQRLSETALSHTDDPPTVARLHLVAAQAAIDVGHNVEGREHARIASDLFDELSDPIQAGLAAAAQATASSRLGDNASAIEVAEPRWHALEGLPGTERALLALSRSLSTANAGRAAWAAQREYTERAVLLAEAVDDPAALAMAHTHIGVRYAVIGAPTTARLSYQAAAGIARDRNLPEVLARAMTGLAALLNSRDLAAALACAREGMEVSRRAGLQNYSDYTLSNYLIALWTAGQLAEASAVLAEAKDSVTNPALRFTVTAVEGWLADAYGARPPRPEIDSDTDSGAELAWRDTTRLTAATAAGDHAEAARIAVESFDRLVRGMGIDDDFMVLWPPIVRAALADDDPDLAGRLLAPVAAAQPGQVSPAVAAQWRRLNGLVGAARGEDPAFVESEFRAGIDALEAFGAIGYRAQAQEELANWLINQSRPSDAAPLLDAARATYIEIGAAGWLTRLDANDSQRSTAAADQTT